MIKRLKRRFIIVNMSILTCVLLSVLVSILALMYSSEVKISYELMESIMSQKDFGKREPELVASVSDVILNVSPMSDDFLSESYAYSYNAKAEFEDDPKFMPDMPGHGGGWDEPREDYYPQPIRPEEPPHTSPPENPALPSPLQTEKWDNDDREDGSDDDDDTDDDDDNRMDNDDSDSKNESPKYNDDKESSKDSNVNSNSEKIQNTTVKTSIKNTVTASPTIVSESAVSTENNKKQKTPDEKKMDGIEPDPFRGKVKRSYVYVEFKDIDGLEKGIYQYCTSEDEDDIKEAVETIYNSGEERGKINIGDNKYRYMFRYNPPKMNYSVVMLDRTLETNTLNRLMITFIIIAGAGLIFIFFISLLLSNWTIKPVEKAWTQQKEFIANASHELKTPLTVISTNTDVVLSNPEDSVENQSKWLNYIKNETIRMSKLVNNLLCIAKYDANKIKVVNNKIDLSNLVSSICLQYEPLVFENKKTLITEIDNNIEIMGDEDKIKQVVNILMDNALKYSLNNGTIKVLLKRIKQSSVCMTISNTSENISQEQLDKLFDRFYRIEDSRNRKTGGSGLGLNIAKTIVESHKGTISVINRDNITSFIVTL